MTFPYPKLRLPANPKLRLALPKMRLNLTSISIFSVVSFLLLIFLFAGRWSPSRLNQSYADLSEQTAEISHYDTTAAVWMVELRLYAAIILVFFIGIALSKAVNMTVDRSTKWFLTILSLFSTYLCFTTLWSIDPSAGLIKSYEEVLNLVGVFTTTLIVLVTKDRQVLYRILFFITLMLALGAFIGLLRGTANAGRLSTVGGGPNPFARHMGFAALCAIATGLLFPKKRLGMYMLGVVAMLLLVASGSRGGMVATFAAFIVLLALSKAPRQAKTQLLQMLPVGIAIMLLIPGIGPRIIETFRQRIIEQLVVEQYASGRDQLAIVAQDMIRESPIVGHGFGAYNILGPGKACYPHNIFLEITCETGLIGCALFVAVLVSVFVCIRKQFRSPAGIDMFALLGALIQLIGAQFSGDLYDSRMMLFFFALLAIPMASKATDEPSLTAG